jgi:predicted nucleic acid-binding protein
MHETLVIADSSCLILLSKIEELEILRSVYKQIHITPEIAEEFGLDLPDWIEIKEVNNKALQLLFQETLDVGESSALALAYETQDCTVIIDELKARKTAAKMNIRMTGTIGLILIAKNQNKISSAKSVFDKIRSTNFRISDRIINEALKEAGELSP